MIGPMTDLAYSTGVIGAGTKVDERFIPPFHSAVHLRGRVRIPATHSLVAFKAFFPPLSFFSRDRRGLEMLLQLCQRQEENFLCKAGKLLYDSELHLHRDDIAGLAPESRFVVIRNRWYLQHWLMDIHAGIDFWNRAEDFITKRRSKEINGLECEISGDASEVRHKKAL
ncbi:hypothetical protein DFH08DRAFT_812104 [Mycena albidolilacea]|uniref:Uncharacterized protein n=1 Tax=Mycena albidolilacea TaxID=1033008 RepID=A0AAD7EP20_9AGAR|nr:hypothetical protein DFH08DRAFT_812104 [Mycena albidolilacea]